MEMGDIVKMTFATDARYRDAFRAVRAKRVGDPAPASTRVITSFSMPALKVEIEIIAAKALDSRSRRRTWMAGCL